MIFDGTLDRKHLEDFHETARQAIRREPLSQKTATSRRQVFFRMAVPTVNGIKFMINRTPFKRLSPLGKAWMRKITYVKD
jgi:hypothetical protein